MSIKPDKAMRSQFHHVVDIVPTIYELLGITPPKVVNGEKQIQMMIIEQYSARSAAPITAGRHKIEVVTDIAGPGKAGTATLFVDSQEVGKADLTRTVSSRPLSSARMRPLRFGRKQVERRHTSGVQSEADRVSDFNDYED